MLYCQDGIGAITVKDAVFRINRIHRLRGKASFAREQSSLRTSSIENPGVCISVDTKAAAGILIQIDCRAQETVGYISFVNSDKVDSRWNGADFILNVEQAKAGAGTPFPEDFRFGDDYGVTGDVK